MTLPKLRTDGRIPIPIAATITRHDAGAREAHRALRRRGARKVEADNAI